MVRLTPDFAFLPALNGEGSREGGLKVGAIRLRPGRVEGIIEGLAKDDSTMFPCHKTIKSTGVEMDEDGNDIVIGEGNVCAGSLSYLIKMGRIPVGMRLADSLKLINIDDWEKIGELTLDPDPETKMPIDPKATKEAEA